MESVKDTFDFSVPQRQSMLGVVVLFVNGVQKSLRAFWPVIVLFFIKKKEYSPMWLSIIIILGLIFLIVIAFLRYWFFKFYIDEVSKEFTIESGVLNKTRITLPFHKIQKVEIQQNLLQRLCGVYKLEIDSAGSDKKEVSISAITHEMAVDLKKRLLADDKIKQYEKQEDTEVDNSYKHFISISLASLLKIGVTSNYLTSLVYLFVVFGTLIEKLKDFGQETLISENVEKIESIPFFTLFFIIVAFLILSVLLINIVTNVVRYFNLKITKNKSSFTISYGLINLKNTILYPEKVQIVKVKQNYFQKKWDANVLEIKQATSDEKRTKNNDKIKIPGCTNEEKKEIFKVLFPSFSDSVILIKPRRRKFFINVFIRAILPVILVFMYNYINNKFNNLYLLFFALIYIKLITVFCWFSFKNYHLKVSKNIIEKKSGSWDIDYDFFEPHKIQAIKTNQFFWQKRNDVGSVILYTAGGTVSFTTGTYSEIKKLVNYWLFQVETSDKNWM